MTLLDFCIVFIAAFLCGALTLWLIYRRKVALQAQENLLEKAINLIPDIVFMVDDKFIIQQIHNVEPSKLMMSIDQLTGAPAESMKNCLKTSSLTPHRRISHSRMAASARPWSRRMSSGATTGTGCW